MTAKANSLSSTSPNFLSDIAGARPWTSGIDLMSVSSAPQYLNDLDAYLHQFVALRALNGLVGRIDVEWSMRGEKFKRLLADDSGFFGRGCRASHQ